MFDLVPFVVHLNVNDYVKINSIYCFLSDSVSVFISPFASNVNRLMDSLGPLWWPSIHIHDTYRRRVDPIRYIWRQQITRVSFIRLRTIVCRMRKTSVTPFWVLDNIAKKKKTKNSIVHCLALKRPLNWTKDERVTNAIESVENVSNGLVVMRLINNNLFIVIMNIRSMAMHCVYSLKRQVQFHGFNISSIGYANWNLLFSNCSLWQMTAIMAMLTQC